MDYLNEVVLAGLVADEPVRRIMRNGKPEYAATISTENRWLDSLSGEPRCRTDWHHIILYGRLGDRAQTEMQRGVAVRVEGRLRTRGLTQPGRAARPVTLVEVVQFALLNADGLAVPAPPASAASPRARTPAFDGTQSPFTSDFGPYRTDPDTDSDSEPLTDF